jgi:hypothetical protein
MVLERMEKRFTPEELATLERVLKVMDDELMHEIRI